MPSLDVEGRTVIIKGKWLRIASVSGDRWMEGEVIPDPETFFHSLKQAPTSIDLFTFAQKLPDTAPCPLVLYRMGKRGRHPDGRLQGLVGKPRPPPKKRERTFAAPNAGAWSCSSVEFTDDLVRGIKEIYDESPVRQGRRFWHYGKDLQVIKAENRTHLERSELLGAFREGELIGFLKMVYVGTAAYVMQIVAKNVHCRQETNERSDREGR